MDLEGPGRIWGGSGRESGRICEESEGIWRDLDGSGKNLEGILDGSGMDLEECGRISEDLGGNLG